MNNMKNILLLIFILIKDLSILESSCRCNRHVYENYFIMWFNSILYTYEKYVYFMYVMKALLHLVDYYITNFIDMLYFNVWKYWV